jgi:hypothetical protein
MATAIASRAARGALIYHRRVPEPAQPVSTDAVMREVRDRVKAELHARLTRQDADTSLAERTVFDEVDAIFRQALAHEQQALLLPALLADEWRPRLSLDFRSHRAPASAGPILFVKRRILAPAMRWLFEYSQDNFRRQDRLNLALLACLQSLAADHARLKARLAALEAERQAR